MKKTTKSDVQFLVDEKGNPSAVVIDIDLYEELIEQLEELKFGELAHEFVAEEKETKSKAKPKSKTPKAKVKAAKKKKK